MKFIYLPTPLLMPAQWPWPQSDRTEPWALPLRLAVETGGPLKRFFEAAIDTGPYEWWDSHVSSLGAASDFVFETSAEWWLARGPVKTVLHHGFLIPALTEQAEICFPETRAQFSELEWRRLVKDYATELNLDRHPVLSIQNLRYFAGFLRSRKIDHRESQIEWARVSALFSVEPAVPEPGTRSSVTLNPTATFIQDHSSGRLLAIARAHDESIVERELDWQQAAIVDELNESGKSIAKDLLRTLAAVDSRGLQRTRTDEEALGDLERWGLVFRI